MWKMDIGIYKERMISTIWKTDADNYRALSVSVPVAEAGTDAAVSDGLLLVRKSRIMRIMNERISRCFLVRLIFI